MREDSNDTKFKVIGNKKRVGGNESNGDQFISVKCKLLRCEVYFMRNLHSKIIY